MKCCRERGETSDRNRGQTVYVAGIARHLRESEVEKLFSKYGRVVDVRVVRDRETGEGRGFGFLVFEDSKDAQDAIRALDGTDFEGKRLVVELVCYTILSV